jgi:hypothetical protein
MWFAGGKQSTSLFLRLAVAMLIQDDKIKLDVGKMGPEYVKWAELAADRGQCQSLLLTVS